jgi:hypothetical protein
MTTFAEVYAAQREELQTHKPGRSKARRKPALLVLAGYLAVLVGFVGAQRRGILYLAGFGFIDYAAWGFNHNLGYAAIGLSLLVLDALSGGDEER